MISRPARLRPSPATIYYGLSLLAVLFFEPACRLTGETNLPPLHPLTRAIINAVFLNLWAAYVVFLKDVSARPLGKSGWIGFAAVGLVLCASRPIFSGDVYEYLIRGRILGVYHQNPYAHASIEFPNDIFFGYSIWRNTPDNYGPAWGLVQWIAPTLFGFAVPAAVFAHKALLVPVFALSGWLFHRIASRVRPREAPWLTAMFVLNPNLITHHLIDGHNDIVMVFWMLLAVHLLMTRRLHCAMAAGMLAALVKFSSLIILPVLWVAALRMYYAGNRPAGRRFAFTGALVPPLVAVLLYAPFWIGGETFAYFRTFKEWFYTNSVPYAVQRLLGMLGFHIEPGLFSRLGMAFFALNAIGALAWLGLRRTFNLRMIFIALLWMFTALHLSYAIPFYGNHLSWELAFLILAGPPHPVLAVTLFSFAGVFAYFKRLSFLYLGVMALYVGRLLAGRLRRRPAGVGP